MSRRNFLTTMLATAGSLIGCATLKQNTPAQENLVAATTHPGKTMPERVLGKTGVRLPILGLGGAGQTPLSFDDRESPAIALIESALQLGIRYFDTAASYGPSEDYLGKVLPAYRKDIFLASKTSARDRDGAWRDLEQSLKRLNTDYLDLWQLHHLSFDADLDTILSRSGAIKAIEEAKQQKLIRFSGVTGHHEPAVIAAALQRYPFDTTLVSINAADAHHPRPFAATVLPVAQAKNVGVIAMKVPAYGRLFKSGGLAGMHQAMGYVLSLTGVHTCIIAAESVTQLEQNVAVAKAFKPLSKSEIAAISQRAVAVWEENTFFRAWT
jgi:aryl-alcohol dehydrogenase-like predicted oxidoreductase